VSEVVFGAENNLTATVLTRLVEREKK